MHLQIEYICELFYAHCESSCFQRVSLCAFAIIGTDLTPYTGVEGNTGGMESKGVGGNTKETRRHRCRRCHLVGLTVCCVSSGCS